MFGDISAWFYKALAGINPDPASPAFKHFIIKPNVVGGLTLARATYNSIRGPIVSDWKTDKEGLHLTVTIPANTTATVSLPGADPAKITEGKGPAAKAEGVELRGVEDGRTVLELGSGTYQFTAPFERSPQADEIRSPKAEVRKKAEIRIPKSPARSSPWDGSASEHSGSGVRRGMRPPKALGPTTADRLLRVSAFGLLSDFGFRPSALAALFHRRCREVCPRDRPPPRLKAS